MFRLALVAFFLGGPYIQPPPPYGVLTNITSASSGVTPCYGDNWVIDADFVGGCSRDTDAAPQPFMIHPQDNYAAGAQTATNLRLRGGMDERTVVIGTAANCGSDTLVFTLSDGTTVTLTEGVDFTKVDGDNAATAAALLVPILLQTTLVDTTQTTRSSATLRLQHHRNSRTWTLSTNDVNGCFTLSNGTDGLVTFDGTIGGSLSTGPALVNVTGTTTVANIRPDRSSNSGLAFSGAQLTFLVGGSTWGQATATNFTIGSSTDTTARGGLKSDVGDLTIEDNLSITGGVHIEVIEFCGQGPNGATTVYLSPRSSGLFGDATCDAEDSTTETTADEVYAPYDFSARSMICGITDVAVDTGLTFTFRDDTATASTDLQCTTGAADGAGFVSCNDQDATPPTVAAGSAIAMSVVAASGNFTTGDIWCRLTVSVP